MKDYLQCAASEPQFDGEPTPEKISHLLENVVARNHPFIQQASFMRSCGQSIDTVNWEQARMYQKLIDEEYKELNLELYGVENVKVDLEQVAKEGIDLIYVVAGLLHSLGIDSVVAFAAVQDSNATKVDPETGQVRRREDGKILKPEGWQPPDMSYAL